MAQLPVLIYDQKPPMSSVAFKELAQSLLNEKDAALMKHLALDPEPHTEQQEDTVQAHGSTSVRAIGESYSYINEIPSTGCSFIDSWREWERTLRLNLAKQRAHTLKRDNEITYDPPVVPIEASNIAMKAVSGDVSPIDAEVMIDKARWNAICSISGSDYFNRDNVFAYYLKLVLMERKLSFNTDNGFSEYKSLYASILEKAQQSVGEPS
jgi:hypothetical protein